MCYANLIKLEILSRYGLTVNARKRYECQCAIAQIRSRSTDRFHQIYGAQEYARACPHGYAFFANNCQCASISASATNALIATRAPRRVVILRALYESMLARLATRALQGTGPTTCQLLRSVWARLTIESTCCRSLFEITT
jgi:hypothetical protein